MMTRRVVNSPSTRFGTGLITKVVTETLADQLAANGRPSAPLFEPAAAIVGTYSDPACPVVISEAESRLFREESEFHPIVGGWYYLPAGAATFHLARDADANIESVITPRGSTPERAMCRIR